MEWVAVLGWTLVVVGACVSLPQTARLLRTRDTAGISPATLVAMVVSWVAYLVTSIELKAWPKAVSETIGLLGEGTLLTVLVFTLYRTRGRAGLAEAARGMVMLAPVPALMWIYLAWGVPGLGLAMFFYDAVGTLPQFSRTLRGGRLSGLSLPSYLLSTSYSSGWMIYGIAIGSPWSVAWTFLLAPMRAIMVWRIILDRRRGARAAAAIELAPETAGVEAVYPDPAPAQA